MTSRRLAAMVLLILASAPVTAQAQGSVCRNLANELARLSSIGGGGEDPELAKWDRAIRDQAYATERTEDMKRRSGCDGGAFLFSRADPGECKALDRRIRDMRAKLAKMERGRDRVARQSRGRSSPAGRIASIRREMQRNDCGAPGYRAASRQAPNYSPHERDEGRVIYEPRGGGRIYARRVEPRDQGPDSNGVVDNRPRQQREGLFGLLFGGSRRGEDRVYGDDWGGSFRGTYRTLCVRTCDGYYFPISFSTTQEMFGRDSQACSSMCPGDTANAQLFIHHNPGEGSAEMVSLDGQPYKELENAFRYRSEFDASCTCESRTAGMSLIGSGTTGMTELTSSGDRATLSEADTAFQPADQRVALPIAKISPDEDPDTQANELGNFRPERLLQALATTAKPAKDDGAEKPTRAAASDIRIVGPNYFVAQ